ncbi:MAG: antibiotic biosynthesis monooxygenase family protein [Hyphomonas sp.]
MFSCTIGGSPSGTARYGNSSVQDGALERRKARPQSLPPRRQPCRSSEAHIVTPTTEPGEAGYDRRRCETYHQPGKEADFEKRPARISWLSYKANEPGCLTHQLYKSKRANVYIFMEQYASEDALKSHGQTE